MSKEKRFSMLALKLAGFDATELADDAKDKSSE